MAGNVQEMRGALATSAPVFGVAGIFSLFINLLMLTGPIFMLQVYDRVLTSRSGTTLAMLVMVASVLLAVMVALEVLRSRLLVRAAVRIDEKLKSRLFGALMDLRLKSATASAQEGLRDLDTVRQFLSGNGLSALFDAPWMPLYLVIIFLFHPLLGAVAAGGAVALFLLAVASDVFTRRATEEGALALAGANRMAEAGFGNAEVVRAMGMTPALRARWLARRDEALTQNVRAADRLATITALSKGVRLFLLVAILAAGAGLAIEQIISPGVMIAASIMMGRALSPVEQAIGNWRGLVAARAAMKRIAALLVELPAPDPAMPLPAPKGHLAVENVIASAPGAEQPVIKRLSFMLAPGEALGVIGPSASGKSCLARLLVGVWRPSAGHVRLDGAELAARADLGRHVGYLPQTVELFEGTVSENIARFECTAAPEMIVQAAAQAGAHEMIMRLPKGYDTEIGLAGAALSAGQRQRIGLARALYGAPALIVLDEPNANLDGEGETGLIAALRACKERGQTLVVMAHRPSAVMTVDRILVLRDGAAQALGPRDEVLAKVRPAAANADAEQRAAS